MAAASAVAGEAVIVVPRRNLRRWVITGIVFVALIAMGMKLGWHSRKFWERFNLRREVRERQLTSNPAERSVYAVAISPDGKYLAYSDPAGLHLRLMNSGETHALPVPEKFWAAGLAWYPDGTKLIMTAGAGEGMTGASLWSISILGNTPQLIRSEAWGGQVSPDGSQVSFFSQIPSRELWVMPTAGGEARCVVSSTDILAPGAWSPDGSRIVFLRQRPEGRSIETVEVGSGKTSTVFSNPQIQEADPNSTLAWLADGRVLFVTTENSTGALWELHVDPLSGMASGEPRKITEWPGQEAANLSATSDGKQVSFLKVSMQDDVYVAQLEADGTRLASPRRLTFELRNDRVNAWTPDGRAVLLASNRNGNFDLFQQNVDQENAESLILGPEDEIWPRFTPDGSQILYWSRPLGTSSQAGYRLMRAPATGGIGEPVPGALPTGFRCPRVTKPCVAADVQGQVMTFFELDPVTGRGKTLTTLKLPLPAESRWDLSPDGTRIAVNQFDAQRNIVLLVSVAGGPVKQLAIAGWTGLFDVTWSPNGDALYLTAWAPKSGSVLLRATLDGRASVLLRDPKAGPTLGNPIPSPDGRRLAYNKVSEQTNGWLLENF